MKTLLLIQAAILAAVLATAYHKGVRSIIAGVEENRRPNVLEAVHMGLVEMAAGDNPVLMNVSIHQDPDKDHFTVGASNCLINKVEFAKGIAIDTYPAPTTRPGGG